MAKYIDADKLARDLQLRCDALCPYTKAQRDVMCRACLLGDAIDTVEDQPAADVVEVVRCKDCIYHTGDDGCANGRWDNWTNSEYEIYPEALEMDYCSYGVRKNG